ncbi:type IVB secretion system protein IcmH/DotU [Pseudomonas sp. NPDC089752]|uniref:type IVB secretion system protein IcmH/DotU n=1 Tax=Pseudomonas sp. NPDC089752 TaxID=3364472 RepID=UPI0038259A32
MNVKDPLAAGLDPDRTMLLPRSNGRPAVAGLPSRQGNAFEAVTPCAAGLNPLVRAAHPLLALVMPLRCMARPPDMATLRQRLMHAIRQFETQARACRVEVQTIAVAHYALCTLVDETISCTAWGAGVWNSRSLLVTFHNEAGGGERFFRVLQRISMDARTHLELLELMYLCLALGLEGRYRVIDRGSDQLAVLRERLYGQIRLQRGAIEHDLSPRWRGAATRFKPVRKGMPLWAMAIGAAVLVGALELTCRWLLDRSSASLRSQLAEIRLAAPVITPIASMELSSLLADDIEQGLVSVRETAGRWVISLSGQDVFNSGSTVVLPSAQALLQRIGDALSRIPGEVLVVGHTDNQPPSPRARLRTNAELSEARARAVVNLLGSRTGPSTRYRSEGRGAAEPLAPNDSPANRARNRRVDITFSNPVQPQ